MSWFSKKHSKKVSTLRKWRQGWVTKLAASFVILGCHAGQLRAQVVSYEGIIFPEVEGWERRLADTPGAEREIVDGWFVQSVDLPAGWPGPNGDYDFYRLPLAGFVGAQTFFVEWRVITDNPTWLLEEWQVPTVVVAGGNGPGFYHTVMTDGLARLLRDLDLLAFATLNQDFAHTYRLELFGDQLYVWFVDGEIAEMGIPEGAYPDPTASLTWGAGREHVNATTAWDYVRVGVIPQDGSGDYDSDSALTLLDQYFVHDCLTKDGPGIFGGPGQSAGPGCRFADFDSDSDTDLVDFAEFQNLFSPS